MHASLSARRAWIEIRNAETLNVLVCVALRKESVDRNSTGSASFRACIVALRKESVDRNFCVKLLLQLMKGRSPQGERG